MTGIEERLAEILHAEADRHQAPVFSARGIAENAVRKGFWRRRPVLLLAAIGLAGATGATGAVVAAGRHHDPDRVTVTFANEATMPDAKPVSADAVREWLHTRIQAEGLKDVHVTVQSDPLTLIVSGRAADVARLRMLPLSGHLLLGGMSEDKSRPPTSQAPCPEPPEIGPPTWICGGVIEVSALNLPDAPGGDIRVAAHAEQRRPGAKGWAVVARLDAHGTGTYRSFTDEVAKSHEGLMVSIDGRVVLVQSTITGPVDDGVIVSEAAFTEQQARDLATILETPGPWPVAVVVSSVDYAPHHTG